MFIIKNLFTFKQQYLIDGLIRKLISFLCLKSVIIHQMSKYLTFVRNVVLKIQKSCS